MEAVPLHMLHIREANEFVAKFHRHSLPTVGGKFAIGAAVDATLVVRVTIPVARRLDAGKTLQVLGSARRKRPTPTAFSTDE